MKRITTSQWNTAGHLQTDQDVAAYLEAALAEDDPALVLAALGDIAQVKGLEPLAQQLGTSPERLRMTLSPTGNPKLATVLSLIRALGLQLHVSPRPE